MNLEKWWVLASIPTTMPPSLKIHGIVLRGTRELSNLLQLSIAQNAMAHTSYELCTCYMRERKRYAVCILLTSCRLKANAKQSRWSEKDTCEISQQQQQPHRHTHTLGKENHILYLKLDIILIKQILEFYFRMFYHVVAAAPLQHWDMLKDTQKYTLYVNKIHKHNNNMTKKTMKCIERATKVMTTKWYLLSYNKNRVRVRVRMR